MTGLEALNKFVNIFAEYCVKTQHQEMNATNMQTAVEYLARSNECRTIEKSLRALEIIKKRFIIEFDKEEDLDGNTWGLLVSFQSKEDEGECDTTACANLVDNEEDFNLLKEVLGNERN